MFYLSYPIACIHYLSQDKTSCIKLGEDPKEGSKKTSKTMFYKLPAAGVSQISEKQKQKNLIFF